ncbi:Ubiquitin-like protein ATG12 [Endocarpon pusillum Z07020]|uniref:Ubiquitin-like protein ATG12 n=1 Tax=Endocarpon pusillum (strain Z07020 / HMAS-L-300199) TaxID=1263415 RepID=U1I3D0_ENDPU|nr:Ubiquitin-like protein ATG12 [Endocarpon pusillum Z07020]ERF76529.1 Ubiquitin-like protein ATG12 [Endocarpon pusillum Z07020]
MASPSLPPSSTTTPSSGIGSDTPPAAIVPDEDPGVDLPMTMSASVILTNLPRDASQALSEVEALDKGKVTVRFKPVGSAPILRTLVFKISASMKFETVVNFLRKKLDCKPTDSVFLYVNSVFAPGLDEGLGNLFRVSSVLLLGTSGNFVGVMTDTWE